jgi:type VI secretion system secreted protein Hcp
VSVAAFDYFLKIDGIQGDSADAKHKGEIDLLSFSWGETSTTGGSAGGGAGAGKVHIQDAHFVTQLSKASPPLMLACASGQHFKQSTLTCRKSGTSQAEFLVIRFEDVLVSSYQTGGGEGDLPIDQFSINFAKIRIEFRAQRADGKVDPPVTAGWDVKANKKL